MIQRWIEYDNVKNKTYDCRMLDKKNIRLKENRNSLDDSEPFGSMFYTKQMQC